MKEHTDAGGNDAPVRATSTARATAGVGAALMVLVGIAACGTAAHEQAAAANEDAVSSAETATVQQSLLETTTVQQALSRPIDRAEALPLTIDTAD